MHCGYADPPVLDGIVLPMIMAQETFMAGDVWMLVFEGGVVGLGC